MNYQLQYFINDAGGVSEDGLFYSNDTIGNCSILMLNLPTFDRNASQINHAPAQTLRRNTLVDGRCAQTKQVCVEVDEARLGAIRSGVQSSGI